jgi:hypothetical protein
MHCNGTCHLKKELQQDEQKKNTPLENVKVINHFSLFSEPFSDFKNYFPRIVQIVPSLETAVLTSGYFLSVFHPPSC